MRQVRRGVDEVLGLLKLIRRALALGAADRFPLAAKVAARISDPHAVAIYDFGSERSAVLDDGARARASSPSDRSRRGRL